MQASIADLKSAADAAFRAGDLEGAWAGYSAILEAHPCHVSTLCNRSLTALKLGRAEAALEDADAAVELASAALSGAAPSSPPPDLLRLAAKAHHRRAEALLARGRPVQAVQAYRAGLLATGGAAELSAALRLLLEKLPAAWLASVWGKTLAAAQAPHPWSSRDGRLLKPPLTQHAMPAPELQRCLEAALEGQPLLARESRDLLAAVWAAGRRPGRAEAAFHRAAAYLAGGAPEQAARDVRVALAYGPHDPAVPPPAAGDTAAAAAVAVVPASSLWAAALALQSGAHEGLGDNIPALLAAAQAAELDPGAEPYLEAVERLSRRVPEAAAAAAAAGGSAGLRRHLAAAEEAALPEFKRQRPQYWYYYEWMRDRIEKQYPALPGPVMDKLLTLEAGELDLVMQYPQATRVTVERLLGVLEGAGAEALETYRVPLLSWEQVSALREGRDVALAALPAPPPSAPAPQLPGASSEQGSAAEHGGGGGGPAEEEGAAEAAPSGGQAAAAQQEACGYCSSGYCSEESLDSIELEDVYDVE